MKEVLNKVLPPSVNSFRREISRLQDEINAEMEQHITMQDIKRAAGTQQIVDSLHQQGTQLSALLHEQGTLLHEESLQLNGLLHEQRGQLDHLEEKIQLNAISLNRDAEDLQHLLDDMKSAVSNGLSHLNDAIERLKRALYRVYYYCPYEVEFLEKSGFFAERDKPDYLEHYQALVRGLDEKSITTVNRILSRHSRMDGHADESIDLFSVEEQRIIKAQRDGFYADMLEIVPGIFACGKYLLSSPQAGMGFIETTVFLDHAGFEKLQYPERIRNKDILDIGAFIGDTSLVLSEFTDQNVYAFEPGSDNFRALKRTIELNDCTNIIAVQAGVGAHHGEATIDGQFGMGLMLNQQENNEGLNDKERVPIVSIDGFVEEHNLTVGLIKVDVEGYEQEFLKGAEKTIHKQRPALLLSMYHTASDFFGLKPILESWDLGYHFQVHKEVNEHIHFDTMLIAETK